MKIAVCFFGITRSLSHTIQSIEGNILAPARARGEVRTFCHFYDQRRIDNPRTGEQGELNPDEHQLLQPDVLRLESSERYLSSDLAAEIRAFGDHYRNDFYSLNNLLLQLFSLRNAWEMAEPWAPDICLYVRPDLYYHDSFDPYLVRPRRAMIQIANWGSGFAGIRNGHALAGVNDRFAICHDRRAMRAYGTRIKQAVSYCAQYGHGLHAESLLRYTLVKNDIKVARVPLRASRVRFGGHMKDSNFRDDRFSKFRYAFKRRIKRRMRTFLRSVLPGRSPGPHSK